jgi:hypothetical protein
VLGAIENVTATAAPAEVVRVLDTATAPVESLVTAPAPLDKVGGPVPRQLDSTTALLDTVTAPVDTVTAPLDTVTAPLDLSSQPSRMLDTFTTAGARVAGAPSAAPEAAPADRHATRSPSSGGPAPVSPSPSTEVGQLALAGSASSVATSGSVATTMAGQKTGSGRTAGVEPQTAVPTTVSGAILSRGPPTSTGVNPTGSTSQAHITPVSPPPFPGAPGNSHAGGTAYSAGFNTSTHVAVLVARLGSMALGPERLRSSPARRQLLAFSSLLERPG